MQSGNSKWGTVFWLVTGSVAFVADILFIVHEIRFPGLEVSLGPLETPHVTLSVAGLEPVHWTLAGLIYVTLALGGALSAVKGSWRFSQLESPLTVVLAMFPALLLALWSTAYFPATKWVVVVCGAVSGLWLAGVLGMFGSDNIIAIAAIGWFPTLALFYLGTGALGGIWAWVAALVGAFIAGGVGFWVKDNP